MSNGFLPVNATDMKELGWDRPDFVYVNGDAYVDHPSFGVSIITRVLEDAGFRRTKRCGKRVYAIRYNNVCGLLMRCA